MGGIYKWPSFCIEGEKLRTKRWDFIFQLREISWWLDANHLTE